MIPIWMRRIWESLYNLYRWAPVIWSDRDWDYGWLLRIMEFKFRNMRELHEQNRRFEGWDRTVSELRTCELLLKRIREHTYMDHEWERLRIKYPRPSLFDRGYVWYPPSKQEAEEYKRLFAREKQMEKQDLDLFCKLLTRKYGTWWD